MADCPRGRGAFRQRLLLWTTTPAALLSAGVLLFSLGSLCTRVLGMLAGLGAALALLLPAVIVSQVDAASEENGFAGCGTFLDPTPIAGVPAGEDRQIEAENAATCAAALHRQKRNVLLLAVPGTATAVLSLLRGSGVLRQARRGRPRRYRGAERRTLH